MIPMEAPLAEYPDTYSGAETREDASQGPERGEGRRGAPRRPGPDRRDNRRRNKLCQFCAEKAAAISYRDVPLLRQYVSERGRIFARRKTGTCAKHQRMLAQAIKRARQIALLPYTAEHVRVQGS
jgi:small subunit ribosomal protein S18